MNRDFWITIVCIKAFAVFFMLGMQGMLPGQCDEPARKDTLACAQRGAK